MNYYKTHEFQNVIHKKLQQNWIRAVMSITKCQMIIKNCINRFHERISMEIFKFEFVAMFGNISGNLLHCRCLGPAKCSKALKHSQFPSINEGYLFCSDGDLITQLVHRCSRLKRNMFDRNGFMSVLHHSRNKLIHLEQTGNGRYVINVSNLSAVSKWYKMQEFSFTFRMKKN